MRLAALEVEGFGIWSGLRLEGLAEGLGVIFGPNEAGKTTLLEFVRGVLYGYWPACRRYFPPVPGGRPGGRVELVTDQGRFEVRRYAGPEPEADELMVLGPDGATEPPQTLNRLVYGLDEATFRNVFAIGLDEIHSLATLNNTQAATYLYDLSAGVDRVSLMEVLRELGVSRQRLLDPSGGPCQIAELLARRDELRSEIEGLAERTHRYLALVAEREQLDREAAALEGETAQLADQCRLLEAALLLEQRWHERRVLDQQLDALGPVSPMPAGLVERVEAITARLAHHSRRLHELQEARTAAAGELRDLGGSQRLARLAPRIEALAEQDAWLATLRTRLAELEEEIRKAEESLATEHDQFDIPGELPTLSAASLAALRRPAKALRQARQRMEDARREAANYRDTASTLAQQVQSSLQQRGENDLHQAAERLARLVSLLRRRLQVDERLEELLRHRGDLEEESEGLVQRQVLSGGKLALVGGGFIAGSALLLLGVVGAVVASPLLPAMGWGTSAVGLALVGVAVAAKRGLERSAVRRVKRSQEQLRMLKLQIQQARQERDSLDQQLPRGSGSLAERLQAAERRLAELEELIPLDARRQAAEEEASGAAARAEEAQRELAAARRRWCEAVRAAGLPPGLSPRQVGRLVRRSEQIRALRDRLARLREEHGQRTKELQGLVGRIAQLARQLAPEMTDRPAEEQLEALRHRLADEEVRAQRRRALRRQCHRLGRQAARHRLALVRLRHERRRLFEQVGLPDEAAFRQHAERQARFQELAARRQTLCDEIAAALAGRGSEKQLEELLAEPSSVLRQRHQQLHDRLQSCQVQLRQRHEKRGQIQEQLRQLAEDGTLAEKHLALAAVEHRLEMALRQWQVLSVTYGVLEQVRKQYEATRQPQTLQDASQYLAEMTEGRYHRVWTPLSEPVLRVDDSAGRSHSVENLSRGLREQLFLCLRLALAAGYAQRGVHLPLLLDDVLVNFDRRRATAAARVLDAFAKTGHQVLVFTCHDHLAEVFAARGVPVRNLPTQDGRPENKLPTPLSGGQMIRRTRRRRGKRPVPDRSPGSAPIEVRPEPASAPTPPEAVQAQAAQSKPVPEVPLSEPATAQQAEPFAPWQEESDPDDAWGAEEDEHPAPHAEQEAEAA